MLETLVSSRIRRTLFEYLLTHSTDRFYLRGLAKQLNLSISPLRRELARLEQSGMLQAVEEGNMRFYTVNITSPAFLQLKQAGQLTEAPSHLRASNEKTALAQGSGIGASAQSPQPSAQSHPPIPIGVISTKSIAGSWRSALRGPALIGAAVAGMALMLIMASLFYITMTNGRLMASMQRALTTRSSGASVMEPHPGATSGAMRGARWQLIPGSFGGFSTDSHRESY